MGLGEIIFALIMIILIWYTAFRFKIAYDSKKILQNIEEKIGKQNQAFFSDGKEINLKKQLGLVKREKVEKNNREEESKNIIQKIRNKFKK